MLVLFNVLLIVAVIFRAVANRSAATSNIMSHTQSAAFSKPLAHAVGKDNLLRNLESAMSPLARVLSLLALGAQFDGDIQPQYLILSTAVFALSFPRRAQLQLSWREAAFDISLNWLWIAGLLAATAYVTGYLSKFSSDALVAWFWVAPLADLGTHILLRHGSHLVLNLQGPKKRALIVGLNEQGLALAKTIEKSPYSDIDLVGFVCSRQKDRLHGGDDREVIGTFDEVASLVKRMRVQLIYLSLPMASQPRILQLLDELKDTTASVYFVPDMFVTDLIQGHPGSVHGMPVISVCETPFKGINGLLKRGSDIVLSILILVMIFPVLIAIAVAVKMGSPGPIIFKQRRYGLDGEEILVYKFRSMTVTEDGGVIQQAQKNDSRITPLGGFLRRTSLDELPQFVNVLQGRMSIVGPRPHAVAHNELYRKLIKGYMVRHKVKPGITGWAQVNGYRGETEALEKMQARIDYDLDYLRNWSLRLDLHIILKTIRLVLKDQKAY